MTAEQERLVTDNLDLVRHIIHKYCWRYLEFQEYEDLFQIGCIGLVRAALAFDKSRGYKFSTLAAVAIRREITKTMQSRKHREELYHSADDLSVYDNLAGGKNKGNLFRYEVIPDPHDPIQDAELCMDIAHALSRCTAPQRDAFQVRIIEGKTLAESGLVLGITRRAVDYRMRGLGRRFRKEGILP